MSDVSIQETGDGGDFLILGGDVVTTDGFFNQPYLAMFGGNIEQSHQDEDEFELTLERFDFWGNNLFHPDEPQFQFNSETERALLENAANSQGLQLIRNAVMDDLRYMQEIANIEVQVSLIALDQIQINIDLTRPRWLEEQNFVFLWDSTLSEPIIVQPDI